MRSGGGVVLAKGKDKAVKNRHHWIFSGAVERLPEDVVDGNLYPTFNHEGELLGYAYVNRKCSILGRMVSFGPGDPFDALRRNVDRALALRAELFGSSAETDAYRIVNAEGDGFPGLIVDRYAGTLVVQIATLGMERLKDFIVGVLIERLQPESVYEKSDLPSRREEGLGTAQGILYGRPADPLVISECSLRFSVNVADSQKTGFYLDQREMRRLCGEWANGRKVLNAFSYTGGFSVSALKGGAVSVDSVDASRKALDLAKENYRLNGLVPDDSKFIAADVFEFMRMSKTMYDLIVLDPPAFAKRKTDVMGACRGYKDINRLAFQRTAPGGILMTFSCSHFVDDELFRKVVFQAAAESSRNVRILQKHRQAPDHPVNIFHPETEYLKGLTLYID